MAYTHFSKADRFQLQALIGLNWSQTEMAACLNKDKSAVSRELARNSYPDGHYHAGHAHKLAQQRRKQGKRQTRKLVKNRALRQAVIRRLKKKDSPEQIAGRRKRESKAYVCPETIYQYIYQERPDLTPWLRQKKGRYRRRWGTKAREKRREQAKKTWITDRPEEVEQREVVGHWEGDTVLGRKSTGAIGTFVERKSGFGVGIKLENLKPEPLKQQVASRFNKLPENKRRSLTLDNGVEFTEHELLSRDTDMAIYFALPYHSWERGTNENWNGLLREFFPKQTSFARITQQDVQKAVNNLNHRPRKRLNYLTPYEVFVRELQP